MQNLIESKFDEISNNFLKLKELSSEIEIIDEILIKTLKAGNKIMFCGNGGSASDAQHLASELVGNYKINRKALNAISLATDTSGITAFGNDFGFEHIFARQIEGLGNANDVLVCLSTSGNSKNILNAIKKAKELGIKTILLTGENENLGKQISDYTISAPSKITNSIQEMHIAIGHLLCEIIEKSLF